MNNIKIINGHIFTSKAQTLVNTINTVGVMGAGVALGFRLRYPDMYKRYKELCKNKLIQIGKLWLFKASDRWILNFPTKENWKDDSKIEYLEKGLQKFTNTYKEKNIDSIAFPILGSSHGKIPEEVSLNLMLKYLEQIDIPIEIYKLDLNATDDVFIMLKNKLEDLTIKEIFSKTGIQKQYLKILVDNLNNVNIKNIVSLAEVDGIGLKTLEKVFDFIYERQSKEFYD